MRSVSASFRGTLMLNCFYGLPRAGSQLPSASVCAVRSDSVHQSFCFGAQMAEDGHKRVPRWPNSAPRRWPQDGQDAWELPMNALRQAQDHCIPGRSHNCWGADNDRPQALSIMPSYQQAAHMFCVSIIFGAHESSKNSSGAAAGSPPKRDLEQQTD